MRKRQIDADGLGVRRGASAAGVERFAVVGHPGGDGVVAESCSRASLTRSLNVVSATSWRGVKRSPNVVMP